MLFKYKEFEPEVHESSFIAPNSSVIGRAKIAADVGIWFNAVVRADIAEVVIGEGTNIQDGSVVHVDEGVPTILGKNISVGHGAILHSCTIGDNTLVGMGAIVLSGAQVGNNCIIGAGALVTGNSVIPDNSMVLGSPAKIIRNLKEEEIETIKNNSRKYVKYAREYVER